MDSDTNSYNYIVNKYNKSIKQLINMYNMYIICTKWFTDYHIDSGI
jgi:hypothetical protein